ncbi:50S ribosomal protein L3 [Candidatus Woesearchaeota archaeon]|nr:50S ribosomal protein L3 [Candidatus Woesearchaeota archaeon]
MGKKLNPRHGSMQVWPRKRATRQYAKVRSPVKSKEVKPLAFAGYKAGMTHVVVLDNHKHSITKGERVSMPVTVIECPPLRIASVRFYKAVGYGRAVSSELFFKTDKFFSRKAPQSKKLSIAADLESIDLTAVLAITIQVYTQPNLTGVNKKTPEVFELPIGGSVQEQLAFVKENLGKEINVKDVLAEGAKVDARAVTKGKGYQGPVKRFGVSLRAKKSEKTKRGPGSLGAWIAQGHTMYRMAFAGQTGYHQRFQHNNLILGIYDDAEKVNPSSGFINYGNVKSTYLLVRGSVPGPKKRLILLTPATRPSKSKALPTIEFISTESKQGN